MPSGYEPVERLIGNMGVRIPSGAQKEEGEGGVRKKGGKDRPRLGMLADRMKQIIPTIMVMAIPAKIRDDGTVCLNTIKLGLSKFIPIIVFCHEDDYGEISLQYQRYKIETIITHQEQDIDAIRYVIMDYLLEKYAGYFKIMMDDDISGLNVSREIEGGSLLPPGVIKTINNPHKIFDWICNISFDAWCELKLQCGTAKPGTVFRWTKLRKSKVKSYSETATIHALIIYTPNCKINPYNKKTGFCTLEELGALKKLLEINSKPVWRDNHVAPITPPTSAPNNPNRQRDIALAEKMFGPKFVNRHVRSIVKEKANG
jgi:hypothetical protein